MTVTATPSDLPDVLPPLGPVKDLSSGGRQAGGSKAPSAKAQSRRKYFDSQFYKTRMCAFWQSGKCTKEDSCKFAHGMEELQEAPNLTGTSMCKTKLRTGKCADPKCMYAHDVVSLRATDQFYKTTMCKFYRYGTCKLGEACRHAHSPSELRSTPVKGSATPSQVWSRDTSDESTMASQAFGVSSPSLGVPEAFGSPSSVDDDEEAKVMCMAEDFDDDESFSEQSSFARCTSAPAYAGAPPPPQVRLPGPLDAALHRASEWPATVAEELGGDDRSSDPSETHWSRFQSEPCRSWTRSVQRRPVPKWSSQRRPAAQPNAGAGAPEAGSVTAPMPVFEGVAPVVVPQPISPVETQPLSPVVFVPAPLRSPMAAGVAAVPCSGLPPAFAASVPPSPTTEASESSTSRESTPRQIVGAVTTALPVTAFPISPSASASAQVPLVGFLPCGGASVSVNASLWQQVLERAQPDHYEE